MCDYRFPAFLPFPNSSYPHREEKKYLLGVSLRKLTPYVALVVNALRSEQVLTRMLSNCPQTWALAICLIGNPLCKPIAILDDCKFTAHCIASYALACTEKRRDASKRSGGLIWFDSISHLLSTSFHEASSQRKQRLVTRREIERRFNVSVHVKTPMETIRREHWRRKQVVSCALSDNLSFLWHNSCRKMSLKPV
jgi:hypothetical protein